MSAFNISFALTAQHWEIALLNVRSFIQCLSLLDPSTHLTYFLTSRCPFSSEIPSFALVTPIYSCSSDLRCHGFLPSPLVNFAAAIPCHAPELSELEELRDAVALGCTLGGDKKVRLRHMVVLLPNQRRCFPAAVHRKVRECRIGVLCGLNSRTRITTSRKAQWVPRTTIIPGASALPTSMRGSHDCTLNMQLVYLPDYSYFVSAEIDTSEKWRNKNYGMGNSTLSDALHNIMLAMHMLCVKGTG